MESKEQLIINFEGDNDIDLEVLSTTLNSTLNCLKVIADETLEEKDYCKFIVRNVEKGSFIIFIEALRLYTENIMPLMPDLPSIVAIFREMFELRKLLKGEKPKNIEEHNDCYKIENNEGNIQIFNKPVVHIYTSDNAIDKEMAKFSQSILKDDKRTGVTIKTSKDNGKSEETKYNRDDLKLTTKTIDAESLINKQNDEINEVWLSIRRTDFVGDTKWDFIFMGNQKISAYIEDRQFLKDVRDGKISFSADTKLKVKLRVRYLSKEESGSVSKIHYTVIEVLDVIKVEDKKQITLDLD